MSIMQHAPALTSAEMLILAQTAVREIVEREPMTEDQVLTGLVQAWDAGKIRVLAYLDYVVMTFDVDEVLCAVPREHLARAALAPSN